MTLQAKLSKQIKEARKRLKYSQYEVAEAISVSVRWYQKIEAGQKLPNTVVMLRLILFLELDPEDFREEAGLVVPVSANIRALAIR